LRLLNRHVDYDTHFPPEAEGSHTAGLQLLRVTARARAEHGVPAVGRLYASLGAQLWQGPPDERDLPSRIRPMVAASLAECGLPQDLSGALGDSSWDAGLQAETDQAMRLVGNGVGTPVLHFSPPDGSAFCGPVISRLPEKDRAVELWDSVVALAGFPGFAALRRNVSEPPVLPAVAAT
jgi:hypothetical protein